MSMQDKDDLFERRLNDYLSGMITDEEKAELFSLISSSELYRQQYDRAVKLHALLHVPVLEAEKEAGYLRFCHRLRKVPDGKSRSLVDGWRFAAAAVVLIAVALTVSVYLYNRQTGRRMNVFCETVVPLGSQTRIMLPDSSVVVLNSGSVLKYPVTFGKEERKVYLAGEGYFEVKKNKKKTFRVYAGNTLIQVTGTVFNVRSYPDDIQTEIALIEGGVEVSAGEKTISLKPNERALYNRESGRLERQAYETYKSALWTTGKLSFVNASFREILKEIERKYNVKIHVMSRQVDTESFSGTIHADMTLQEVFNFIDVDKKYVFESSGHTILLKDR